MTRFEQYCARGKAQHGERFNPAGLAMQFLAAYNQGQDYRVLVDCGYDAPIWGFVGVTTGWGPSFLLMRRYGQHGSSILLSDRNKILSSRWLSARTSTRRGAVTA